MTSCCILVLPCSSLAEPVHPGLRPWTQTSISASIHRMNRIEEIHVSSSLSFTEEEDPFIISGLVHYTGINRLTFKLFQWSNIVFKFSNLIKIFLREISYLNFFESKQITYYFWINFVSRKSSNEWKCKFQFISIPKK